MNSIPRFLRKYSFGPPVSIYQNLYATKPAARNRPKTENFKSYESLGKINQPIWREQLPTERGLGPIADECPKESTYKNPEYFSYHNYTFYNLAMAMQCMYQPQPNALEDRNLAEQTTKSCYVVEVKPWDDGTRKKNPPPSCVEEDCKEDSKEGKEDGEARDEKSVCQEAKIEERPNCGSDKNETKN
ncbi:hypothetical protein quinque_002776 [Culex quinquefasciatus]